MSELTFVAPSSVAAVLDALADPGAVLVGGGTSLALLARAGLIEPTRYVSVGGVPELRGIDEIEDRFEIGVRGGWPGALAEQLPVPVTALRALPAVTMVRREAGASPSRAGSSHAPSKRRAG